MPLLLSYLNVSNRSNLLADSGVVFQTALLEGLQKRGWETVLVGPAGSADVWAGETIEITMPDQKYGIRFGFAWDELVDGLRARRLVPDVVLMNQPELTIPLASAVSTVTKSSPPIVTYFHYLPVEGMERAQQPVMDASLDDFGLGAFIWARQVEAATYSRACVIGSRWGRRLFLAACNRGRLLAPRFHVIPPPVDDILTRMHLTGEVAAGGSYDTAGPVAGVGHPARILYNHRLYGHYGTRRLFDWLAELHRSCAQDFRVVVTNPTACRSDVRRGLDSSVETVLAQISHLPFVDLVEARTREDYLATVMSTHLGIAPMRRGPLWSMAVADLMAAGRPVLAYRTGAYQEVVGDLDLVFDDKDGFLRAADQLICDARFRADKGRRAREAAWAWRTDRVCEQFADVLNGVLTHAPARP